jgi:protein-S-isoprenylcysteine O-methyltransferase Ste14
MGATAIEFRLRMLINAAIIILGLWAPWIEPLGMGKRISLLEWLALELARLGLVPFTVATPIVIVVGSVIAALAVVLRVAGSAWLGPYTVSHPEMQAGAVVASGPYRFVRNPLYLGVWFMVAAMALVMPPSGALFAMVLITVFLFRLTLGEETFLSAQLGQPYRDYLLTVPRFLPRLRSPLLPTGAKPHWVRAILSELTPIGIFIAIAFFSWSYDHTLMLKAILISFGASLVVRAFLRGSPQPASPAGTA